MRTLMVLLVLFATQKTGAQVLVNIQFPPSGVSQKSQLWNLVLTNTGSQPRQVHIELMFTDVQSGQQVMSATTRTLSLMPGTIQTTNTFLGPIQYNVLSSAYYVDPSPAGLLPVGYFNVCYVVLDHVNDIVSKVGEECSDLLVEPLAPPTLQFPEDSAVLSMSRPVFNWLPPMPSFLFTDLRYDFELVEVNPNQSPSDAIQQNIPYYRQSDVSGTSFPYPATAPPLMEGKYYAWRVIAKSLGNEIGPSQTWVFSWKQYTPVTPKVVNDLPFAKLTKDGLETFSIFFGLVMFEYTNETTDTVWNVSLTDISITGSVPATMAMDSIPLRPGQNLVRWDPEKYNTRLQDKHLYILEVRNSRLEVWRLRFEYRKEN